MQPTLKIFSHLTLTAVQQTVSWVITDVTRYRYRGVTSPFEVLCRNRLGRKILQLAGSTRALLMAKVSLKLCFIFNFCDCQWLTCIITLEDPSWGFTAQLLTIHTILRVRTLLGSDCRNTKIHITAVAKLWLNISHLSLRSWYLSGHKIFLWGWECQVWLQSLGCS